MTVRNNTRFFKDSSSDNFYVVDDYSAPKGAIFSLGERRYWSYEQCIEFWGNYTTNSFSCNALRNTAIEVLPDNEEKQVKNITKLSDLQGKNFLVNIEFDDTVGEEVGNLLAKVYETGGLKFRIYEGIYSTDLVKYSDADYNPSSWNFFGVVDGRTLITDDSDDGDFVLSLDEFRALIDGANETVSVPDIGLSIEGALTLEGNVKIVYRNGQGYDLGEKGKATIDSANRVLISERSFIKDGMKAYERVEVKLEAIEVVHNEKASFTIVDKNTVVVSYQVTL